MLSERICVKICVRSLSVFSCPALWLNLGLLATHSQSQQSHGALKHSTRMKNQKRGPMAPQLYFWDQCAEVQCGKGARKRGALVASWCELKMAQASLEEVCHCLDKRVELSNPLTQQFHFWVTQQTTHMATLDTPQAPRPIHLVFSMRPTYYKPIFQDWRAWSPCCPRDSQESSPTPRLKCINRFFGAQPSLWSHFHIPTWLLEIL